MTEAKICWKEVKIIILHNDIVRVLGLVTVILLSVGIICGLLILVDYADSPRLISRDQALALAVKTGNWSKRFLDDKTLDMKLLHVKTNNFAFIVDEKTFKDIMPFCPQQSRCTEPQETSWHGSEDDQYVWVITVQGQPPSILSGHEWGYIIDAKSGQVLR